MSCQETYIEVAVAAPLHHTLTYGVPDGVSESLPPGTRVQVPFGRPSAAFGQRSVMGYVLGPAEAPEGVAIKKVVDVLDEAPVFPAAMIAFFRWIADYYIHPLGEVIKSALPAGLGSRDHLALTITDAGRRALAAGDLPSAWRRVLAPLAEAGTLPLPSLARRTGAAVSTALVHRLASEGLLATRRRVRRGSGGPLQEQVVSLVKDDLPRDRYYAQRRAILDFLAQEGDVPVARLAAAVPRARGYLGYLEKNGFVRLGRRSVYRDPLGEAIRPDRPPRLTDEQAVAVDRVNRAAGAGFGAFLLNGVTGSGKTEVYLRLAADTLQRGRTVLVLVPEIALISQMERRFRARFGERVAVLHSGLTGGQRCDQWRRIARGETPIVVGVRSAVFAPLADPGLIVVDEEHDSSYKEQRGLLYNARDLAVVRARLAGAVALLGSATPSVQSLYNVNSGKFRQLTLTRRVSDRPMPRIQVVDLRRAAGQDPEVLITAQLRDAMHRVISRGEQVLLFLNRRGYAGFPVCGRCGRPLRCRHCDITLTLHRAARLYRCHYCGFTRSTRVYCEKCGSAEIKPLGLGTEKLEAHVRRLFPAARVVRMDADTTAARGATVRILKDLRAGAIDILIGTQMVAKGHDFPNITLVGIICADLSLNFPDFRAGERTFQLLAQVAGRAGRGDVPGRVILQTYNPEHFSIAAARRQDVAAFYETESAFRSQLGYPPFSRLIHLRISGPDADKTRRRAEALGDKCRRLRTEEPAFSRDVQVLGPIEASLPRLGGRFRWQILLRGRSADALHRFTRRLIFDKDGSKVPAGTRLEVDVDPVFMM